MGWRMIWTKSFSPTETCPCCWWPSGCVWLMRTNVSSHENPGSWIFFIISWFTITEFKIRFSKPFPWGKSPFKNTYSYKKVNLIQKCSIVDSFPHRWWEHQIDSGGRSHTTFPCSCPGEQPHKEPHTAFKNPAKGWGAADKVEPLCRQGGDRKSLPLVSSAWKAFLHGRKHKGAQFQEDYIWLAICYWTSKETRISWWLDPAYNQWVSLNQQKDSERRRNISQLPSHRVSFCFPHHCVNWLWGWDEASGEKRVRWETGSWKRMEPGAGGSGPHGSAPWSIRLTFTAR